MAETSKGNKRVYVHAHDRKVDGHKEQVPQHYRSTPHTSTGKKKGK